MQLQDSNTARRVKGEPKSRKTREIEGDDYLPLVSAGCSNQSQVSALSWLATVAGDKGGTAVTVSTNEKVPASGGKAPTTHSIPGEEKKEKTKGGWTERWAPPRVGRRHFSAVARSGASWRATEYTIILVTSCSLLCLFKV